ncbi:MAG: hypothetical protein MI861_17010, partial [Pirellulales bacterium]|nr:hypothetical protein [Pirellulales bacterium]
FGSRLQAAYDPKTEFSSRSGYAAALRTYVLSLSVFAGLPSKRPNIIHQMSQGVTQEGEARVKNEQKYT